MISTVCNVTAFLMSGALKKGSRKMQERFKEWAEKQH